MTGNEQARSGHFCLCGYGAKAPLTAKAVISGAGVARKFGKQRKRVWGRSAQQAEDCEAISKKPGDGRWSLLQSDGFRLFYWPQTALCCCLKTKLAEIVGECAQADSPAGVQRSKTFGAELEAAEASNVPPSPSNPNLPDGETKQNKTEKSRCAETHGGPLKQADQERISALKRSLQVLSTFFMMGFSVSSVSV